MPKITRSSRRKTLNHVITNCSSSDEMEVQLNVTKNVELKRKKSRQNISNKRPRAPKNEQPSTSSRKEPARKTKVTNNTNIHVIELDDSDDESKYIKVNESIQGKVDNFFKSSGLVSDDEDEVINIQNAAKQDKNFKEVDHPSNVVNDVVIIDNDTNEINTIEDIENYCKETENLLKDANALLDKFAGYSNENILAGANPKPNEGEKGLGECPICYDKLSQKQVMSTKCGHLFCKDCMNKIITTVKKCPTCRKAVDKRKVFPIYI